MFNFKFNFNFVPVSTEFIEEYMGAAHGEYVKVYLYILNMAIQGSAAEPRHIARKLNMLESDVINAIEYWQEKQLLDFDGTTVTMGTAAEKKDGQERPQTAKTPDPARTKKTAAQLNSDPLISKRLAEITEMAQTILEKSLNDKDISTLYWFSDELGFSAELIMMLLEYCVSIDKRDMRYIEKVAIKWHERGIRDVDSATEYMVGENERKRFSSELKSIFGINDRSLSKTEEEFIAKWRDDCGMSAEMIALAYEYCVLSTNKLSFRYMDSIIKNWKKLGITTVAEAQKEHEDFKKRSSQKFSDKDTSVYSPDGTDFDEIERRMNEKY